MADEGRCARAWAAAAAVAAVPGEFQGQEQDVPQGSQEVAGY